MCGIDKLKSGVDRLEKHIENKLKKEVEKKGGWCVKFVSPGTRGMPDRKIFMPGGAEYLVETKSKTGVLTPIQKSAHKRLEKLGFKVWIVKNEETLKNFLDAI